MKDDIVLLLFIFDRAYTVTLAIRVIDFLLVCILLH